jgi:hypothetical protein
VRTQVQLSAELDRRIPELQAVMAEFLAGARTLTS